MAAGGRSRARSRPVGMAGKPAGPISGRRGPYLRRSRHRCARRSRRPVHGRPGGQRLAGRRRARAGHDADAGANHADDAGGGRDAGAAGAAQVPAAPREPAQAADSAVSDWFRNSRSPAPGSGGSPSAAPPASGGWRAGADDGWAEGKHAAQIVADPVRGDQTAAGLPVRVPRANLIAGSAGGHRAGSGATSRPPDGRPADSRPADGRGAQAASAARAPRSPELARSRLSGFQRGTRRAKGQTPHAGEGADR